MVRRTIAVLCTLAFLATGAVVLSGTSEVAAAGKKTAKKPLTKLQHDPSATEVDLFAGIEAGQLSAKLIPKNAFGGNVLIENLTDEPLTVKLPEAAVGVPKHLAQFGGGAGGFGGGGLGGGGLGGGGGGQQTGGGFGGGGGGLGGQGGGGGGFFGGGGGGFGSIPAESVASVPFNSVCLEHGKPEPTVRSEYVLVPVETVSNDPILRELLEVVGTGKVDRQAAQAAAWHLTDDMSFEELANKAVVHAGGNPPTPYFTRDQLLGAQTLLSFAKQKSEESPKSTEPKPERPENIRSTRTTAVSK